MSWNYRIMTLDEGKTFGIHEVYYDGKDNPVFYTENAICPIGESIQELMDDMNYMLKAFEKPILTPADVIKSGSET